MTTAAGTFERCLEVLEVGGELEAVEEGLAEIGLSLLLFFAASLYARWGAEARA